MNYSFETQGPVTYLSCELDADESIDSLALGMITNNHIIGVAPVLYSELNSRRFLKYNVSAKIPVSQFFAGMVTKQRCLTILKNVLDALCSADDYMIMQSCFELDPNYIFVNVSSCEVSLICVPVNNTKDANAEVKALVKWIVSKDIGTADDKGYVEKLLNCVDNDTLFSIYSVNELVKSLEISAPSGAIGTSFGNMSQQNNSFGSVGSTFGQNNQINGGFSNNAAVQNTPLQSPMTRNTPQSYDAPQCFGSAMPESQPQKAVENIQRPPMPAARPIAIPNSPIRAQASSASSMQRGGIPIPPSSKREVPIPSGKAAPLNKQKNKMGNDKKKSDISKSGGSKDKITLLDLMLHYNKENVEKYKAQKHTEKERKSGDQNIPKNGNANAPETGIPPVRGAVSPQFKPMSAPANPISPSNSPLWNNPSPSFGGGAVPVNNQFTSTVVLDNSIGETTVLSPDPAPGEPYITRMKNGEKVVVNKPIFRIGKERSYVDYFISDNTAISRSHANIIKENDTYYIEDTNSTNHTYLNGAMITGNTKVKLSDGDRIRLANEDFTFSC